MLEVFKSRVLKAVAPTLIVYIYTPTSNESYSKQSLRLLTQQKLKVLLFFIQTTTYLKMISQLAPQVIHDVKFLPLHF